MAGYNSDIHDPIDDLIVGAEEHNKKLSIDQLNRLLIIVNNIMQRALADPYNKKEFFKSQLECDQAACNSVFVIRIKALIIKTQGYNNTEYVLSCFSEEAKRNVS
jgi:hypothetical protein